MKQYSSIRWDRLQELGIEFTYIKKIVNSTYKCEINELELQEFIKNISSYDYVDEVELLNILEEEVYKKASVFSIVKYKKNKGIPIIQDITTMLNLYFKEKNNIKIKSGQYYNGELSDLFNVTYYKQYENYAIIKMARVFKYQIEEPSEDGSIDEIEKVTYDCCKFYIDINSKIVIMFFSDIKESNMNPAKEITYKKCAFRGLFEGVTNKNIVRYFLNNYLEEYFKEYMVEERNKSKRKLVSIIEATSQDCSDEERSLIRSVKKDYIHSPKRLEAIKNDIEEEGLTISEIECCIDGKSIDIKMGGEITCVDTFLYKEVIRNVCKEFFKGYEILQ